VLSFISANTVSKEEACVLKVIDHGVKGADGGRAGHLAVALHDRTLCMCV
jgi:hypothetical protein